MYRIQFPTCHVALPILFCAALLAPAELSAQIRDVGPAPALDLKLAAPIRTWDEAIPLGNGLLGGLLWGEGDRVRLSLDRGDLWDLRIPARLEEPDYTWREIKQEVDRQDQAAVIRRFDSTYNTIKYPTKLPGGRLEIRLAEGQSVQSFGLDLSDAVGSVYLNDGAVIRGFYSADAPVGLFRIPGPAPRELRLIAPEAVKQLLYDPAQSGSEGNTQWFVQKAAKNLQYAAVLATRRLPGETLLAVTLTATWDGTDPIPTGRSIVNKALAQGFLEYLGPHLDYWRSFWGQSRIEIPDQNILKHYYLVNYYLGSASRPGAPPMPLQGVWTADGGGLPPWKGDFHHDLNTQMTYVSYLTAGHFEEGSVFLNFMMDRLPQFRAFARKFYAAPGAAVPGVMTLDGKPMSGWVQYSLSPTNGAWVAWMFYRHWCYTQDPEDLRRAYDFGDAIGTCLEHLLQEENGTLKLPLSSSPEIHNNSLRAWLKPNSNYDRDCMRALFLGLRDMAEALRLPKSRDWGRLADSLGDVRVDPKTGIRMFAEGEPFNASHRHHSHIMGLHPFGLQSTRNASDRPIIHATLDRLNELGTRAWTGYSFSWIACTFARAGRAEEALRYLDLYVNAFILRNGFHVNGDQLKAGFSDFTYRPFTLEGNFLAPEAVHDMLLQSWDGVVHVFPAMPWRWHDAEFTRLRTQGGWIVSGQWSNNACTRLEIEATRDAELVLVDSFNGRVAHWNQQVTRWDNGTVMFDLKAGDKLVGTLEKPAAVPPRPDHAYRGFELPARAFIQSNRLPLRIGADTSGGSRFHGDIARVSLMARALSAEEVADIAGQKNSDALVRPGVVGSWDMRAGDDNSVRSTVNSLTAQAKGTVQYVAAGGELVGQALHLEGQGYLSVPHHARLNCKQGLTLEAWIRPTKNQGAGGARIVDKTPVGGSSAYLLDTYPGNSLRLIHRDPHLGFNASLPVGHWSHVAATLDGKTGVSALYLNGQRVAHRSGSGH